MAVVLINAMIKDRYEIIEIILIAAHMLLKYSRRADEFAAAPITRFCTNTAVLMPFYILNARSSKTSVRLIRRPVFARDKPFRSPATSPTVIPH